MANFDERFVRFEAYAFLSSLNISDILLYVRY